MANRMSNRLVALCAVAIGGIYAAGYGVTESSAQSFTPAGSTGLAARTTPSTSLAQNKSNSSKAASSSQSSRANSSANTNQQGTSSGSSGGSSTQTNTQSSQHTVKYHDGTYQGTGTNPYGTVAVSLKVQKGKISSVQITECTTHYPESIINPVLPNMVVQKQTWQVYIISGATASTYAFAEAVYNALQKAQK